ncbi:unnamed protein product, partial [Heterosigma akashiwo]
MDTSTLSRKNSASSDDGSTGSSATLGRLYDDKLLFATRPYHQESVLECGSYPWHFFGPSGLGAL